ncbi:hypothetical protein [Photobacterium kishitanii]|uniref:Uncharacterized protein n=1 Tax=Photobacterium kishitanii TaxID=318456 RepID=A0AAX0YTF7_9GAMM|nr:hypothetical protein [Photobacterium kishitanii]KJG64920.1 hypothetical protein UA40_14515 [Photobacterium kishitanii]KJG66163.1 hypothetical protein UA41_21190 [Photobacterium kishitanii]OBU31451.1 hypothetical protein AYY23_19515 [Photobacterium kishitanii]PSW45338.1 hypothetical protein C0W66_22755 [Photobacterium kishitanii]PSX18288.1 hypothetical protein C0W70_15565 [Photobacterium kishitanii]
MNNKNVTCANCGDPKGILTNYNANLNQLKLRDNSMGFGSLNCSICQYDGDFEINIQGNVSCSQCSNIIDQLLINIQS